MAKLSDLIISKVRVKLLKVFFSQPKEMFYVRQLTRATKEEINAVRRELLHLQNIGLLKSEKRGNRLYYHIRTAYPLFSEISNLVAKSTGPGRFIIKNKNKLGYVKFALMSQKLLRSEVRTPEDVDLLIVGKLLMPQVAQIVKQVEKQLQTEINYSVMTEDEFQYRRDHFDPFIIKVLLQPKVLLIGDESQLAQ